MFSDSTLTVESLVGVMEKVASDEGRRKKVWRRVLLWDDSETPYSHSFSGGRSKIAFYVEGIYSSHSSEKEKTHACSDAYINCHPESSWEHLTSVLYREEEMSAVDLARPFLPPRGK